MTISFIQLLSKSLQAEDKTFSNLPQPVYQMDLAQISEIFNSSGKEQPTILW